MVDSKLYFSSWYIFALKFKVWSEQTSASRCWRRETRWFPRVYTRGPVKGARRGRICSPESACDHGQRTPRRGGEGGGKVLELNGASKKVADACVGAYFPVLHQKYPAPQPGGILANVISKEVLKKTSLHCQPACTSVCWSWMTWSACSNDVVVPKETYAKFVAKNKSV